MDPVVDRLVLDDLADDEARVTALLITYRIMLGASLDLVRQRDEDFKNLETRYYRLIDEYRALRERLLR